MQQLQNGLNGRKGKLKRNVAYYESEFRPEAIGVSTPPEMRKLLAAVGWPRVYVDGLEERLDIEGFRVAGKDADKRLWGWWQYNNMDLESGMGHLEALIHGIAYITISAPDPNDKSVDQDTPRIKVESANDMYAEINPITGQVTRALRVYKAADFPGAIMATLMLPNVTYQLSRSDGRIGAWTVTSAVEHNLGRVPVVPLINRATLSSRAGCSEITPELRSVTDAAARVMMNMQAASELLAVPQRILFGIAAEEFGKDPANPGAALEAYYARILAFENDQARAEQFTAAELMNFVNVLQELARQVASYTGLPPQYLSHSSENPASAEAIRSAETRLVKKAERKARMFGSAWEEALRLAVLVMDGSIPKELHRMETIWRDPATPTYAAKADGVSKLYANGAGVIPLERARIDMGYTVEERDEMRQWDKQNPMSQLNAIVAGANVNLRQNGPPAGDKPTQTQTSTKTASPPTQTKNQS
jgi:hypothetical protein